MIQEYSIRGNDVRVLDGSDMVLLFRRMYCHSYSNKANGNMDFLYFELSNEDVLSLYSHCVEIKHNGFNSYFLMCASEFPVKLNGIKDYLTFNPGRYVYNLSDRYYGTGYINLESLRLLYDVEMNYINKDSFYKRAFSNLDSHKELFYVSTTDCSVTSCEIIRKDDIMLYPVDSCIGIRINVRSDKNVVDLLSYDIDDIRIKACGGNYRKLDVNAHTKTNLFFDSHSFFYFSGDGLIMREVKDAREKKINEIKGKIMEHKRDIHKLVAKLNIINSQ